MDDPYAYDYKVTTIIPNEIISIDLRMGLKRAPQVNLMFQKIIEDLISNNEVKILSKYEGLEHTNEVGVFNLSSWKNIYQKIMNLVFSKKLF